MLEVSAKIRSAKQRTGLDPLYLKVYPRMKAADFNELSEEEKRHFYKCQQCGEMVDKRQLDDVLFHEDHVQRPDIQYGGWKRLGESPNK
jgi:hypothetical protein